MTNKTQYKEVMDIYRNVMRNAQYFREMAQDTAKAGDKTKDGGIVMRGHTDAERRVYDDIAHELYKVAGELEQTREVNPPAKREDIPQNQRVKVFHILIDDAMPIDDADNLIKAFAWNNSDKVLKTEYHATRELNN